MKRLFATLVCDVVLQFRNGFYYVTIFVIVVWGIFASQIPHQGLSWELAGMIGGNLLINTFFYVAGLVLLEKGEGTLEAQVITPLRKEEYIISKGISLGLLSVLENVLITIFWAGLNFSALPLVLGILLGSTLYVLAGLVAVMSYSSVNEFLFPSMGYTFLLMLPLAGFFGLLPESVFFIHPTYAALMIMKSAFVSIPVMTLIFSVVYLCAWIAGLAWWSRQRLFRFVVAM